jgi:hypothetical protein
MSETTVCFTKDAGFTEEFERFGDRKGKDGSCHPGEQDSVHRECYWKASLLASMPTHK